MERDEIKLLSASSGGIFSAYALSADKLDYVEQVYKSIDISKTVELFWQVFAKGLLADCINNLTSDFDKLSIPICFPVCYIPLFSVKYFWLYGNYSRIWERYLKAAVNYPFLKLLPSFLNGRLAIDGGAADNIPVYPLLKQSRPLLNKEELDLIFILHFDARYDYRQNFSTTIPIIDLDLSYCNNFSKTHYDYSSKTITERINKSYEYGNKIVSRILSGDCSEQRIKQKINEIFLEEHTLRQQNFSIDRMFSFLNIAGKTLRNDAHCIKKLY